MIRSITKDAAEHLAQHGCRQFDGGAHMTCSAVICLIDGQRKVYVMGGAGDVHEVSSDRPLDYDDGNPSYLQAE